MAKQKRDLSWIKVGVVAWEANGTKVRSGVIRDQGAYSKARASSLWVYLGDKFAWTKHLYPTKAEACCAAHDTCIKRANALGRQAAEMRAKAAEYAKRAEESECPTNP